MKNTKRIVSLMLALVMVFAMAITVSADETQTGSILIKNNDTVNASAKEFNAYQILTLTVNSRADGNTTDSYVYAVPAAMESFYATRYSLDTTDEHFSDKVVASIAEEPDVYAFAKDALAAAKAAGVTPETGAAVENGYKFSDIPLGYYVIEDDGTEEPVSALILDTVSSDIEVNIKAEIPPIEKKIDEDNDVSTDTDRVDSNNASIGDVVTYVITSKVPDMTGYDKYFFIVSDTVGTGLTYNGDIQIKIGDKVLENMTDYLITRQDHTDGTTDLKIVFVDFIQYNTPEFIGKEITITYTVTVNNDALIAPDANINEVYLEYSNNPNIEYEGDNEPTPEDKEKHPLGRTEKDVVETYTAALEIVKTDPLGDRLTGATFTLTGESMNIVRVETEKFVLDPAGEYWKLKNGSYTTTDPATEGIVQDDYASTTDKYKMETVTEYKTETADVKVTATVGEDGVLRFEGLGAGEYTITEIEAPDGYNILNGNVVVEIFWDAENGFTFEGAQQVGSTGLAQITIVNQAGEELPSTGGMGTTLFYLLGGVMVAAAVVLLVTKKRMAA